MRILIGNHIDDSLRTQKDQRAFTQRIFWFARSGDIVLLSCAPDPHFLSYVGGLMGFEPSTLGVHVVPPGRFDGRLFDPDSLADEELTGRIARDLRGRGDVSEIFSLWPSAQVAELAERLGLAARLRGAKFFAQQGDELANNKCNFRAFAAASGVPIADGAVCRTPSHAARVMRRLLASGAVMVKQAHNAAALGNQLVWAGEQPPEVLSGAGHRHRLSGLDGVEAYLDERWSWASAGGRFPVVIERFVPRARTLYAEFHADDAGVSHTEAGSLGFSEGRLVEEQVPLRGFSPGVHERLIALGGKLAQTYRAVGYRGYMSADAILDDADNLVFTEMNARIGGSLHLYQAIAHHIVDVRRAPERTVVQYVTPREWKLRSAEHFLSVAAEVGVAYDSRTRRGVIVAMPLAGEPGAGGLLYCIVYAEPGEPREVMRRLAERLA